MDIKDCLLLVTLSEQRNISKTAEKLFISQPAITYRLRQIEEQFNAKIVDRNNKGIVFTLEGEYILQFAKKMLEEFSNTRDHIYNLSTDIRGILRIGITSNFAQYILPELLRRFSETYPKIQINLQTGKSHHMLRLINQGDVHVSILRGDYTWLENKTLIHQERILLISQKPVDFSRLPELPRIYYVTDQLLQQMVDNWWSENYSATPNIIVNADKAEACRDLARTGMGYTILPEICLNKEHLKGMYVYPLITPSGQQILRNTWMLYRRNARDLAIVNAFINFIENESTHGEIIRLFSSK